MTLIFNEILFILVSMICKGFFSWLMIKDHLRRSLNETNNSHTNVMMLMTYIRRTNTLLLNLFICFIVKFS